MVYLPYPIQCNAIKMIHIYFLKICGVTPNGVTVPQPSVKLGNTVLGLKHQSRVEIIFYERRS